MLRSLSALYKANTTLMDERAHLSRALEEADDRTEELSAKIDKATGALASARSDLEEARAAGAQHERAARQHGASVASLQAQLREAQQRIEQLDGVSLLDDEDATQSSAKSDAEASLPRTPTSVDRRMVRTSMAGTRPSCTATGHRPLQFKPRKNRRKRGRASVPLSSIFDEATIEGARQRVRDQLRMEEP